MLLHAAIHWPQLADPSLWPMAVRHAVWIYNHIPNVTTGLSPIDLWSKSRFPLRKLHNLHVWGSPVYVLQKRLADGKSIGRWVPRSHRCVNVGFSEDHSKDAPFVLNTSTGSITCQWNVIFDDWFTTVSSEFAELPDFNADEWARIFGTTTSHFSLEETDTEDDSSSLQSPTSAMVRSEELADSVPSTPLAPPTCPNRAPINTTQAQGSHDSLSTPFPSDISPPTIPSLSNNTQMATPTEPVTPLSSSPVKTSTELKHIGDHNNAGTTESRSPSKRASRRPTRLLYEQLGGLAEFPYIETFDVSQAFLSVCQEPRNVSSETFDPFQAFLAAAKAKDPDNFTYNEAMNDTDHLESWRAAADKEIRQLESKGCWEECLRSEASEEQIVPCTWVFRLKRDPAGDITKRKGRICIRGDLMDDDSENFAPVCSWTSVRLFLVLAMTMGWHTVSVDWANAFIQAVLQKPMYMALPRGYKGKHGKEGCLRLLRSLYGSRFAPRNWYQHLRKALLHLGFTESSTDPCLLYKKDIIMVLYVDDAGIAAPSRNIIDEFVQQLKDLDFDLDIEDDFNSYLGIGIEEFQDGSRHMT